MKTYLYSDAEEQASLPTLNLSEILASLSYALDLTSGQVPGHTERTCLIGLRLGASVGLSNSQLNSLYHALLMKDSGCSSNAARMLEIYGGDEIAAKYASKIIDWTNLTVAVRYAASQTLPEGSFLARARQLLKIAGMGGVADQLLEARCSRGAQIAQMIGLNEDSAECIKYLDEHWDGHGAPYHLQGEQIPILARIACLAQTLEVFMQTFGLAPAYEMLRTRTRRWFDPALVHAADEFRRDDAFWYSVRETPHATLLSLDMEAATQTATPERLDSVCEAFAEIVDAKSHFTGEHSSRVCELTMQIADGVGITGERKTILRRAALLHDLGKLAVPNTILDKDGKPTDEEWACIRRHPYYTQQILSRISGFERVTDIASAHHERLDGRGYFRGMDAQTLDLDMRTIAVADVFDALSSNRPYRPAMPMEKVFAILDSDSLDTACVAVLRNAYLPSSSITHTARHLKAA
jgi:HD-GYP domain-containing protein (c-di-GMP phosphodiesterase class II)